MLILKSAVIWVVMLCSLVDVHQHFGGTRCVYLQGQVVNQAKNQQEAGDRCSKPCMKSKA